MTKQTVDRTALIGGPYRAPKVTVDDWIMDERYGLVEVGGWTDAPISWPRRAKTGKHSPIVCGDLIRAVRVESGIAVAHHWGVSVTTVWAWRKALGVEHTNPGTARLYRVYKPLKLTDSVVERGRAEALSPEALEKNAAAHRGKSVPAQTLAGLLKAARRPKPEEWKRQLSERLRTEWADGSRTNPKAWSEAEEFELLRMHAAGTCDREIAQALGRTINAVRTRRRLVLGIIRKPRV